MEQELTEYLHMRIEPELKETVAKIAEGERRDVSTMARLLIEEAILNRSKKGGKKQ
jgi:hypothetical protein